jgi:hypothetical protein
LTKRSNSLGFSGVNFTTSDNNEIIGKILVDTNAKVRKATMTQDFRGNYQVVYTLTETGTKIPSFNPGREGTISGNFYRKDPMKYPRH